MDINCIQLEGKRDEFKKYLETTGVTEKLTTALMNLYQETDRPEDSTGFIRRSLNPPGFPSDEEIEEMKEQIRKFKEEKRKAELDAKIEKDSMKPTDEELEAILDEKFKALDADENGNKMLKEFLAEDIFDKLKEKKTELGGTLLDNIQCGFTHADCEVSIFASDQYAYKTFDLLFDPVLEDMHDAEGEGETDDKEKTDKPEGEGEEGKTEGDEGKTEGEAEENSKIKQPDLDWGNPDELSDMDPEGQFIKSISITIGRSLHDVPYMPLISYENLKETTEKIRKILEDIADEDFVGKYFDNEMIAEMDEEQKTKLIEEGILFQQEPEDKCLEAAGTYRFWPGERGLFLNTKSNFRVWVNEQEHLQITVFEANGNLVENYKRLVKAMDLLGTLEFARDSRWGFVAHNLKNIGNTMRIVVKAKLPQLSLPENNDKLLNFSDNHQVSYKDLGDGVIELNNKKRFGMTEFETVKEFQAGMKDLITAEKCLYE